MMLLGDPFQLPATIFCEKLKQVGFDRSLFERLLSLQYPSVLLNVQYRMHPKISYFPSRTVYGGRLKDGANVCDPLFLPPYINARVSLYNKTFISALNHDSAMSLKSSRTAYFGPLMFFNLTSSKDQIGSSIETDDGKASKFSRSNITEAILCVNILKQLVSEACYYSQKLGSIGFLTPYLEQVNQIKRVLREEGITPYQTQVESNRHLNHHGQLSNEVKHQLHNLYWYENRKRNDQQQQNDSMNMFVNRESDGNDNRHEDFYRMTENEEYLTTSQSSVSTNHESYGNILDIEINTVDGFQGKEKDIIILSCVRSNDDGMIGFLSDKRRLNVTLTRPKIGLYIIGNATTLRSNHLWRDLIAYVKNEGVLIDVPYERASVRDMLTMISSSRALPTHRPIPMNSYAGYRNNSSILSTELEDGELLC
jgi:superfamily I DNA and/or RNA helicase